MADNLVRVQERIRYYCTKYRNESLPPLQMSGLYELFPGQEQTAPAETIGAWPESYPFADRKGVYVILDVNLNALYIGKTSMNNWLGNRLSYYFGYDTATNGCRIWHSDWSSQPRYVFTVGLPQNPGFEAPAIEEYLLGTVETIDNTLRMRKGVYQ